MDAKGHPARMSQLYWASVLAIVFVGVMAVVAMTSPSIQSAVRKLGVRSEVAVPNLSNDPQVGELISLPATDAFGGKIRLSGRTLVVYAGPCSECTKRSFKPESIHGRFDSMVVIFDATASLLPAQYKNFPASISIIADSESKLGGILNAQWFPRFYLIDSNARLLDIQKETGALPQFVEGLAK